MTFKDKNGAPLNLEDIVLINKTEFGRVKYIQTNVYEPKIFVRVVHKIDQLFNDKLRDYTTTSFTQETAAAIVEKVERNQAAVEQKWMLVQLERG